MGKGMELTEWLRQSGRLLVAVQPLNRLCAICAQTSHRPPAIARPDACRLWPAAGVSHNLVTFGTTSCVIAGLIPARGFARTLRSGPAAIGDDPPLMRWWSALCPLASGSSADHQRIISDQEAMTPSGWGAFVPGDVRTSGIDRMRHFGECSWSGC